MTDVSVDDTSVEPMTSSWTHRGEDPLAGIVTVTGRGRLPSDVSGELLEVLGDGPRIVVCDLTGMFLDDVGFATMFVPIGDLLEQWPGTVVLVCVADPSLRERVRSAGYARRLVVHSDVETGLRHVYPLLAPTRRTEVYLPPRPWAARQARGIVSHSLQEWGLSGMAGDAQLIASELVTNAILHAATVLRLSVSSADRRARIDVRDHRGGQPTPRPLASGALGGRGLHLVRALALAWGVLPSRRGGKTVWAVLGPGSAEAPPATSTAA
jgi:anti-sigma regulatory factor (Ser/Thr protein kinase)